MLAREPASFWLEDEIGLVIRHHSTTSFSENVVVVETSYQMLEVFFLFLRSGEGLTSFNLDNSANFSCEK